MAKIDKRTRLTYSIKARTLSAGFALDPQMNSAHFFTTHPVFTRDDYVKSPQSGREPRNERTADSLLRKHAASGRIVRIRRGLYASVPAGVDPETFEPDPYLVASKVAPDACVSHHAALQFRGRTYSIWNTITFLSRLNVRDFHYGATWYRAVRPPAAVVELPEMGGGIHEQAHAGGTVRITSFERTMVDVLHVPELGGGWEEIWRSLEMIEFFDLDAVIDYAIKLGTARTIARVGVFLDQHREPLFVADEHLQLLQRHRPNRPLYFDASQEKGRLDPRWNVIVPHRILEQTWDETA